MEAPIYTIKRKESFHENSDIVNYVTDGAALDIHFVVESPVNAVTKIYDTLLLTPQAAIHGNLNSFYHKVATFPSREKERVVNPHHHRIHMTFKVLKHDSHLRQYAHLAYSIICHSHNHPSNLRPSELQDLIAAVPDQYRNDDKTRAITMTKRITKLFSEIN